jgi:hypothetical protein
MKRSHDKAEHAEGEPDNSGVLDLDKVYDIQKKEIWAQMNYYKGAVKECENRLLLSKNQISALRLFLLTFLFHFSPESDPKSLVEDLLSNPDNNKDIDETLADEIKRVSTRDVDEADILRGRLSHSKLKLEECEKVMTETREELQILKRRSFKNTQSGKSTIIHSSTQGEPNANIAGEGLDRLNLTIEDQRNEISTLIQKCSSLEKEREALAHTLRIIPPNLLTDASQLSMVLNKYQEIEENNRTLNIAVERYKRDFDDMYARSKSSIEDLKNSCTQNVEAQHEKMKVFREESGRLRQERDKMRTLYEENNSALSHANKKISHLQVLLSSLELKHVSSEKGLDKKNLLAELVHFYACYLD